MEYKKLQTLKKLNNKKLLRVLDICKKKVEGTMINAVFKFLCNIKEETIIIQCFTEKK